MIKFCNKVINTGIMAVAVPTFVLELIFGEGGNELDGFKTPISDKMMKHIEDHYGLFGE